MIRKIYITVFLTILASLGASAGMSAEQVLEKVQHIFVKSPSVAVSFSINDASGKPVTGSMTMCGSRFAMTYDDRSIWYDGRTQWLYQKSINEVSVTEPTAAELAEGNPFVVIRDYKKHYNAVLVSKTQPGTYKIKLTPKKKNSGLSSVEIVVNDTSFNPVRISLVTASGARVDVRVAKVTKGKSLPASYFRYNTHNNPKVIVNDLR